MDFTFSADQDALRESRPGVPRRPLAERLRAGDGATTSAASTADLWSQIVDLGWTGDPRPRGAGRARAGLVDAVVVLEEMGRVPFPGPFFSSAIEATIAARRLGAFDLLEALADGSTRGTIALDELGHGDPVDRIRTRARRKGADWVLTGLKPLVLDGHTADWVIVAARTQEGIGSFLIEYAGRGRRPDDGPDPQGGAARARRDAGDPARPAR